jgi:ankyrin repeat protein
MSDLGDMLQVLIDYPLTWRHHLDTSNMPNDHKKQLLEHVCKTGDSKAVNELLVTVVDIPGIALMFACQQPDRSIVKALIDADVDVNCTDADGNTPLSAAAYGGDQQVVRMLIAAGADVNTVDNYGTTPLMSAVTGQKCIYVACMIIDAGADVNSCDNDDWNALKHSCWTGNVPMAKCLLKAGSSYTGWSNSVYDDWGASTLKEAVDSLEAEVSAISDSVDIPLVLINIVLMYL